MFRGNGKRKKRIIRNNYFTSGKDTKFKKDKGRDFDTHVPFPEDDSAGVFTTNKKVSTSQLPTSPRPPVRHKIYDCPKRTYVNIIYIPFWGRT